MCVSGVGWEAGLAWAGFKLTISCLSFLGQILRGQACVTVPSPEFQFFSVLVSPYGTEGQSTHTTHEGHFSLWEVTQAWNPRIGRPRQEGGSEPEASLGYIVNPRAAWATE